MKFLFKIFFQIQTSTNATAIPVPNMELALMESATTRASASQASKD